jgi:hypothetical protein
MAIIELDLDALTAREIAERLAGTLKCGKARQVATLLDIAARERESERRRPEREARQRQRDQERLPFLQQEAVSQLRLLELRVPFTAADVHTAYRQAAKDCHPDAGGNDRMMRALITERDIALRACVPAAPHS